MLNVFLFGIELQNMKDTLNLNASVNIPLFVSIRIMSLLFKLISTTNKNAALPAKYLYSAVVVKLNPKQFELKCISQEYFEYLLQTNSYQNCFKEGTHMCNSCALISINSLAALGIRNQNWVCIKESEKEGVKPEYSQDSRGNPDEIDMPHVMGTLKTNEDFENKYLIQCFAVSSVKTDFTLYVTFEKYFNILQKLGINMAEGENCMVEIEKIENDYSPETAKDIILANIESTGNFTTNDLQQILEEFFKIPKHIKKNELFHISIKKVLPDLGASPDHSMVDCVYFKVKELVGASSESSNQIAENVGFYVLSQKTNFYFSTSVRSFLPPIFNKFVPGRNKRSYEISTYPRGLRAYHCKLRKLFRIFLNGEVILKPFILLSGPKGSGKKTIVNSVALSLGMKLLKVHCFDFIGIGASSLREKFYELTLKAKKLAPCILLMNNIELLGRNEQNHEDIGLVDVIQKEIDNIFENNSKYPVIVTALTNSKTSEIIPSIARMFIHTLHFEALKKSEIVDTLNWLVQESGTACFPEVISHSAEQITGYRFADLVKLIRLSLRFQREDLTVLKQGLLSLKKEHLDKGIQILDELYSDSLESAKIPSVHWDDVGGLDDLKEEIMIALNYTTNYPTLVASKLKRSGLLFYGPPGTGKTLMAKAIATECNFNFLSVKGPELMNMYVGQSEKNIREVFEKARNASPCIIFFDELDSLAPSRGADSSGATNRIVSQLLTEMDGLESNDGIFIIGATNRPDLIDSALLRPGRFDKMFYVGVCEDLDSKLCVIKALTKRFTLGHDADLKAVVSELPSRVTGADIYSVCSNAWLAAARKSINKVERGEDIKLPLTVTLNDFKEALREFVPSLTSDIMDYYEKFKR